MGLFGRGKAAGRGPDHEVGLALPAGSTVSAYDLERDLRTWAGVAAGSPLPGGLRWSGPRPAADGEPDGSWVYALAWDPVRERPRPVATDPRLMTDIDVAVEVLGWVLGRGDDDTLDSGAGAYAVAAMAGLARRTGGSVRRPGETFAPPDDSEATCSVYLARRPEAAEVVAALAAELPGLTVAETTTPGWVLEAPDGRGLWLEEISLEGDDPGTTSGPDHVALAAVARLAVPTLWVVRVEGADDTADADEQVALAQVARTLAAALDGLGTDPDAFPL